MPLRKRRVRDPAFEQVRAAFTPTAVAIDRAQRALLAAVPTARDPGIPLAQAIAAFGEELAAAERTMSAWRDDRTAAHWDDAARALSEARAEAERLRLTPTELSFEALNERIGDVLHHLEVFADVERWLRRA